MKHLTYAVSVMVADNDDPEDVQQRISELLDGSFFRQAIERDGHTIVRVPQAEQALFRGRLT